ERVAQFVLGVADRAEIPRDLAPSAGWEVRGRCPSGLATGWRLAGRLRRHQIRGCVWAHGRGNGPDGGQTGRRTPAARTRSLGHRFVSLAHRFVSWGTPSAAPRRPRSGVRTGSAASVSTRRSATAAYLTYGCLLTGSQPLMVRRFAAVA